MKAYCTHCHSTDHWLSNCPKLDPSHGNPRVETTPITSIPLTNVRRRPMAFEPKPTPTAAIIAELDAAYAKIKTLEKRLAERTVTENPPRVTKNNKRDGPVTKKGRGRPATETSMTPAERARLYRARKKAGHAP